VADGFVVHNKGGGGFGGGFHGGSSGGSASIDMPKNILQILRWSALIGALLAGFGRGLANRGRSFWPQFLFGLVLGLVVVPILVILLFVCFPFALIGGYIFLKSFGLDLSKSDENLDFIYSPQAVAQKAEKTKKLLEFIAKVDGAFEPAKLETTARETFLELQQCWQSRKYDPMQLLLMSDLYQDHLRQLQGMARNHEINMIADLSINRIDLVNVRYTHDKDQRAFTALIRATARDYYVDDRTNDFLRGDEDPAAFQEFWTFQLQNGQWRLREIEQSRESDVLKEENFFEQFTDTGVRQVYKETADQQGPAGPWLAKDVETKSTRIERLLNFLVRTDPIWNRQQMLERVRELFLKVMLAYESGRPSDVPEAELFPEMAQTIKSAIAQMTSDGRSVEYRNLCVRKVELVLIRNYADNNCDEFTARISAHAQSIARQNGVVKNEDEYVTPFVQYWTFGRRDQQWKLKDTLPEAQGEGLIGQENIDEDSSAQQLQWYYTQTRAM
jgi:predicted lipid-binding transport protein (Tim44 family)